MSIYVHTLGDSTLDNIYWVKEKKDSVEGQLQTQLGKGYKVVSHAYDGFTTKSLLEGDIVGRVLGHKEKYLKEKLGISTAMHINPMNKLSEEIAKNPDASHFVVISVGGNDFRENFSRPLKLLTMIPDVQKKYLAILDKVQKLNPNVKPILMFQYRTDAIKDPYFIYTILGVSGRLIAAINGTAIYALVASSIALLIFNISALIVAGSLILLSATTLYVTNKIVPLRVTKEIFLRNNPGMIMIGALMEKLYKPMLERAKENNISILDLPNSFNPYEPLYTCGIEPSERGGKLIATGLSHIIKGYATGIFRCNGDVTAINPDSWRVEYVAESRSSWRQLFSFTFQHFNSCNN